MRNRRGFALLAALWIVVAIGTVALGFSLEARERRAMGLGAAERMAARAAAAGGLAIARARLERALRRPRSVESSAAMLRASDPWLDADSLFRDTLRLGDVAVHIHAEDLGTKLDINELEGDKLRAFLGFVLRDFDAADALGQAIDDWRDRDDLSHPRGAERKDYLARQRLALPPNRPLRDVDELRMVEGVTPEVFERIAPYLTTQRARRVNFNAAPEPVLRTVEGMTDPVVARILALRSQGRRIQSFAELVPKAGQGQGDGQNQGEQIFGNRATLVTTELNIIVTASASPPARAVQVRMALERREQQSRVRW